MPVEGAKLYKVGASGFVEITNATFDGLTVSYDVTDGGPLDEDGIHNGVIVDPVAIGIPVTATTSATTSSGSSSGGGGSMKPLELLLGLLLYGFVVLEAAIQNAVTVLLFFSLNKKAAIQRLFY